MNRRRFLSGIIAAAAAPAIVRSDSLMKLWVPQPAVDLASMVFYDGDFIRIVIAFEDLRPDEVWAPSTAAPAWVSIYNDRTVRTVYDGRPADAPSWLRLT